MHQPLSLRLIFLFSGHPESVTGKENGHGARLFGCLFADDSSTALSDASLGASSAGEAE